MKHTAVDKFHYAVNDMIARIRPMTSNEAAKIWAECKEMEKEQIMQSYSDGLGNGIAVGQEECSFESVADEVKYYNQTYGGKP
jgi:hypothetical protein